MQGHLALVLLGSLISRTVSGGDLEPVRVGRYSAIVPGPSPEQADPLAVPVHRQLPLSVQTVGRAIEQVLARTGYRLADLAASCPSLSALLDLPLPAVHRTLGPMRLDEALKTLAGPAHTSVIDPVHRLVSFELRQRCRALRWMPARRGLLQRVRPCRTRRDRFFHRPPAAGPNISFMT